MLVRDGVAGLEVFTLRRVSKMVFAGGMTVFPGGGVDPRDSEGPIPWTGPGDEWWAERFHIDQSGARGAVVAAVRELYEETGVLLAGPGAAGEGATRGDPVGAAGGQDADRAAVAAHGVSLAAVLRRRAAALRADLLRPWARWITPPGMPRRYDTFFFVAALPEGQSAGCVTTEADVGGWHRPHDVLGAGQRGEVGLLAPTIAMLTDLADASDVREVLAVRREVHTVAHRTIPILPTVRFAVDGATVPGGGVTVPGAAVPADGAGHLSDETGQAG